MDDHRPKCNAIQQCFAVLAVSLGWVASAYATNITTVTGAYVSTYDGNTYRFTINQPACSPMCAGSYPLMIVVSGIHGDYQMPGILRVISTMAAKGIVAASVEYPNLNPPGVPLAKFLNCDNYSALATSVFAPANSALASIVAASREAEPTRIGVVGYSMGGAIGALAITHNPNIRAFWGISISNVLFDFLGVDANAPCIGNSLVSIPNVRVIDGEADPWIGGQPFEPFNHFAVEYYAALTSGYTNSPNIITTSTGGTYAITPDNTRGWYVVSDIDVGGIANSGAANHFYWLNFLTGQPNVNWDESPGLWARSANLAWMYNALTAGK